MSTKLQLINSALILIGDLPLDSLIGTTRAHVVANALYDNIVQNELSKFRWGFAQAQSKAFQPCVSRSPSNAIWGVFDGATPNSLHLSFRVLCWILSMKTYLCFLLISYWRH